MNCYLCGNSNFEILMSYDHPDKYEKWMGIENVKRQWVRCVYCGFVQALRNYKMPRLEAIYKDGYRKLGFREHTIKDTFDLIMALPHDESENRQRCDWLEYYTGKGSILDVGSGLGVFPYVMKSKGYDVECVEENEDSIEFLNQIGIKAYSKKPDSKYDIVSIIHVLEHIEDPVSFLKDLRKNMNKWLFVEVPDAYEFDYLDKDHDEFNSCHVKFYNRETLLDVLEQSGFLVNMMVSKFYNKRQLSRILALCE